MSMINPLRVVLIGCGDIAETGHVPALMAHEGYCIDCVCDVNVERAQRIAELAGGVAVETDYYQAITRDDIDAVILALHPEHSVDVAIDCLELCLPVLDEKPLAVDLTSAKRLATIAKRAEQLEVTYQVGFVFHYCKFVSDVREFYLEHYGKPRIRMCLYDEVFESFESAHYQKISSILRTSSVIMHEGSHVFDYMQEWGISEPVRVSASAQKTDVRFSGPNLWSVIVESKYGEVLDLEIGWLLSTLPRSTLRIEMPDCSLEKEVFSGDGKLVENGQVYDASGPGLMQDWSTQLDVFHPEVFTYDPPKIGIDAGMRALIISLACEESARTGLPVDLDFTIIGDAR